MELTKGQDRAFQALNDYYGDCKIAEYQPPASPTDVKLEGVDEDGDVRARWIVNADGKVIGAWDPDRLLDQYNEVPS